MAAKHEQIIGMKRYIKKRKYTKREEQYSGEEIPTQNIFKKLTIVNK